MRQFHRLRIVAVMAAVLAACAVPVPEYPSPVESNWLDQGWSPSERAWYHHADQGTLTFGIPREWFTALEQPQASLDGRQMLAERGYLDRFGFIPSAGPLPVGFAGGPDAVKLDSMQAWNNPRDGKPFSSLGLTCAACHTGRLTYQNREMLVDGGAGLLNLGQFSKALGLSMLVTDRNPLRWRRFADRVIGPDAPAEADAALRAQLRSALARLGWQRDQDIRVQAASVEEGFGRLDALNRIGNQVFAVTTRQAENYAATSAPVNFPHIWNASWFDWVQYNGSIEQPMVRNAGEALGVAAPVNLTDPARPWFTTRANLPTIAAMERLLAGAPPQKAGQGRFTGLQSPAWPAALPPVDAALAARGAALYAENCQGCHLPAPNTAAFWDDKLWAPIGGGQRALRLKMIPIAYVGTDPAQAIDMINRRIATAPALGITATAFGPALGQLVEKTVIQWYGSQTPPVPQVRREELDGWRPNGIRAEPAYKARPLNGVWATPPFLHNGSVPTLHALLSPLAERPARFNLGNREFNPVDVGYSTTPIAGDFTLDTTIRGNFNTGHVFDNGPRGNGIIGRRLTPEERRALVEYLKTL